MILDPKYGSDLFTEYRKMQFNHFPSYKSMGAFVAIAIKPRGKSP